MMSTEDTIVVNIDDSQVRALEMRLSNLGVQGQQITGSKRLDLQLPGINRELRLILGQIPGMREAMRTYFAMKRVERGTAYFKIGETGPAILTAVATILLLAQMNQRRIKELERAEQRREAWIRRERGLTKEGYDKLMAEWEIEFTRKTG